jgi:hypothetical protein
MAVLRDMAVEQGFAPKSLMDKIKTVDLAGQKLRHGLAECLWHLAKGEDTTEAEAKLKGELKKGLKELKQI